MAAQLNGRERIVQTADKRKTLRRSLSYPAWIVLPDGSARLECSLRDASQHGAQLIVAGPTNIPDEFTLALSSDGAATRRCRVAWRADNQIGVEFLKKKMGQAATSSIARPTANAAAHSTDEAHAYPVDIEALSSR